MNRTILALLLVVATAGAAAQAPDTTYQGTLRLFVVERESRWTDAYGNAFANALLSWALIEDITLDSLTPYENTLDWNWVDAGWDGIDVSNLAVIAAIYSADSFLVDSDPPAERWFYARPVDVTAVATLGNPGSGTENGGCTHKVILEAGLNTT